MRKFAIRCSDQSANRDGRCYTRLLLSELVTKIGLDFRGLYCNLCPKPCRSYVRGGRGSEERIKESKGLSVQRC